MDRRTYLAGAGAVLGLGALGTVASQTNLLTGDPTETLASAISPGVFDVGAQGVDTIRWTTGEAERGASLVVEWASTPPEFARLHDPDGKARWEVEAPDGSDARPYGLPLWNRGDWELVTLLDGSWGSVVFPVTPSFAVDRFALDVDNQMAIQVSNPSDAPNFITEIHVFAVERYAWSYRPKRRVMPGEEVDLGRPYPHDHYRDVELWVQDGTEDYVVTRDFV